jgi:hypothetical protein
MGLELRKAYEVPELSDAARERVRRGIATTVPSRRKPRWRLAVVGSGMVAALVIGAPIARANYLGFSIAAKLRDVAPFTVTITTEGSPGREAGQGRGTRLVATVADGVCVVTSSDPATDTLFRFEPDRMIQFSPRDGKAVARQMNPEWQSLLTLPHVIAAKIGTFHLSKEVVSRGKIRVDGRELEALEIKADGSATNIFVDLDPRTGKPVRMRFRIHSQAFMTVFRYDWDAAKARQTLARAESALASAPLVDLGKTLPAFVQAAAKRPLKVVELERDRLTIYRVERNRWGHIFVLYTARGYHGTDEERQGNWLRLEDARGRPWLSDMVRFNFSKLRIDDQYLKAQVFFSPSGEATAGRVKLYAQMREWGFVPSEVGRTVNEKGTRRVDFGSFVPSRVAVGQPDWVYEAFNFNDPNWLLANARKLRFSDALHRRDYAAAKKVGRELESAFPETMAGFFYDRARLSLGLYHAFNGTGDRATARKYLQDAIRRQGEASDGEFEKDLSGSRKREGL